jgi:ribonuclease HII
MRRAIRKLEVTCPALIAVDGNQPIKQLKVEQITIVDGDNFSASVAAASIIAKVYRDNLMTKLSRKHPQFGWDSNKGYRSRQHWTAIHEHGMTRWHRRRFIEKWLGMPYPPPGSV